MRASNRTSSDVTKNSNCCCGAGRRQRLGEGQVVFLSGEAGIGKSRLTAALLERLASEPHAGCAISVSPQHTDSAFYPIIGQMERAAGLMYDDTPQAKLDKLDAVLAQTSTPIHAAPFAEMLSLPNDGRYPALDLTPEERRQKNAGSINGTARGTDKTATGANDRRRCALGGSDGPGSVPSNGGPD